MALIGKAYNPFGMGSGGSGLASGFKYAQGLKDRQTFAEGFNEYVNATDDAQKNSALAKMASVDGQNAVRLMDNSLQRELANRQLAQKQAEFDWQKEKFGQMTPAQEAQLDLQRQNLELNRGNVEYTRSKDLEAKEKEKALGQAISEYYIAKDDDGRNAALSKAAMIDPKATSDFYKKIKTQEALDKGWTTDTGRLWEIYNDQNQPEENRMLAGMILKSKASDPTLKGTVAYQTEIGKQAAQAGVPYSNYGQAEQIPVQKPMPSTFGGYMQESTPQAQAMPVQAQQIPTAAQLAQDKETAGKIGEFKGNQQIDELKGWIFVDGKKKALKGSEAEREWLDNNKQALKNNEVITRASNTVLSDIDAILRLSEGKGYLASGFLASALNGIPGTTAADIAARVESIKGNIAVDSLLNIKKSGAGLGQVPQKQAEMLSGLLGNLSQNQSPPEFVNVLKRIRGIYSDIVNAAEKENRDIMSRIYDPNSEQVEQPKEENVISAEEWFNQGRK